MPENDQKPNDSTNSFTNQANQKQIGLIAEFWDFLKHSKKWWLTPIIIVLVLIGALLIFTSAAGTAAPFIYTLF